ncbi:hypothetical protein [Hyalangium sp.]|uniref:hypothetical protein n=1 Tax=Hyalangium sp. TaxID=2028555 RepID=UPI002D716F6E|nr:hypothetical protein [Hyalangium sp.]HYI02032.1 hypothetical protein [Hyalangium sp.]
MAPLPDVLPLAEVPVFAEYLLREFGERSSLREAPVRSCPERSSTVPPMEWEVSTWTPGSWEVRLARPIAPSTEPLLQVKAPTGWSLRCTGTKLGLTRFRIDADSDTWTRLEEVIHKFWSPELEWRWPPTVPKKWRKFSTRRPTVSIVRHAEIIPGGEVLLTGLAPQQFSFAMSVSGEGRPLPVTFLGPMGLRSSGSSERWLCELKPGAPLPRLADVFPGAVNHPYEPLPDAPKRDRLLEEGDMHGLLVARRGGPGRELYEVHLSREDLVRECRFALGSSDQVSALVPEDPTVWTVEWAVNGNYNYVPGHPGSFSSVFGRSLPPAPGATRTYELLLHGLSETVSMSWQARLAHVGLTLREVQPIRGR